MPLLYAFFKLTILFTIFSCSVFLFHICKSSFWSTSSSIDFDSAWNYVLGIQTSITLPVWQYAIAARFRSAKGWQGVRIITGNRNCGPNAAKFIIISTLSGYGPEDHVYIDRRGPKGSCVVKRPLGKEWKDFDIDFHFDHDMSWPFN